MSATVSLQQNIYQGNHEGTAVAWPSGNTQCAATGLISTADAENTANTCTFAIDVSFDGGKSWQEASAFVWQGGTNPMQNNGPLIPGISVAYTQNPPTHARGRVDCPTSLSIGSSLSFSP